MERDGRARQLTRKQRPHGRGSVAPRDARAREQGHQEVSSRSRLGTRRRVATLSGTKAGAVDRDAIQPARRTERRLEHHSGARDERGHQVARNCANVVEGHAHVEADVARGERERRCERRARLQQPLKREGDLLWVPCRARCEQSEHTRLRTAFSHSRAAEGAHRRLQLLLHQSHAKPTWLALKFQMQADDRDTRRSFCDVSTLLREALERLAARPEYGRQ
eukprot:4482631-Pleurochrysis_carterae.AAC.2